MAVQAFDLAERLQTPIFVLSDLDIGMNDWMVPELTWDETWRPDRGKLLDSAALDGMKKFHRYLDTDGDGIPYRTLPGRDARGAYFVRGSGHNKYGGYTEDAAEYQEVMDRLLVKWETAKRLVPKPVLREARQATRLGVIAFGSSDGAVNEALDRLAEQGLHLDYLRLRAFPFNGEVEAFLDNHDTVFVVEQNRDAQLRSLLMNETGVSRGKMVSVLHYNGMPLPSASVIDAVNQHLDGAVAA
jgi:2-oxoglutarate ferredoxin oxidoreductase subunit alpha